VRCKQDAIAYSEGFRKTPRDDHDGRSGVDVPQPEWDISLGETTQPWRKIRLVQSTRRSGVTIRQLTVRRGRERAEKGGRKSRGGRNDGRKRRKSGLVGDDWRPAGSGNERRDFAARCVEDWRL
jgi:hypothetical protein